MELHGFMVANYAETNRGLLYVQGGGWEFGTASEPPPSLLPVFVAGHIYSELGSAPDDVVRIDVDVVWRRHVDEP